MKQVRWGIIGCGDVTEMKSGPGFQKATGSALVAVMRRDAARAEDYARRHHVPRWYSDADRLIADPEVDAVYVATHPNTHEHYAIKVAAAGKPCYVEKPMTRNVAEAARMLAAFERARLPLYVAYYRRGMPRFLKVREILNSGKLGRLKSIAYRNFNDPMKRSYPSVPWRLDPEIAGGGLFLDVGSHALDLLDFFFGPLQQVSGKAANQSKLYAVEDTVDLQFTTPAGVPGEAHWSFISDRKTEEYHFQGEAGELKFSCFGQEPIRLHYAAGQQEEFEIPPPAHVQQPLIQLMADELNGVPNSPPMPSTGESAMRTQKILETRG
jgi:predicted dehydrogenase